MRLAILMALLSISAPGGSAEAPRGPVVIELFTSQGCSSCPPADELLSTWGAEEARKGVVLPLEFHVDYWDDLGWPDTFASPEWTLRQRRYAARLKGGTFTPELVIAGRVGVVGSHGRQVRREVERAAGAASRLTIERSTVGASGFGLSIHRAAGQKTSAHVMLALFENGLDTKVTRGENAGQTLHSDFVVRALTDLGPWEGKAAFEKRLAPAWDRGWNLKQAGAAVFLQDPDTLAITDAASVFPLTD